MYALALRQRFRTCKAAPIGIPIREQLLRYYENRLNRDFYAALAEQDGRIVSVSFLVIQEKPANIHFPTGRTGLILNVFTAPVYRKLGFLPKDHGGCTEMALRL